MNALEGTGEMLHDTFFAQENGGQIAEAPAPPPPYDPEAPSITDSSITLTGGVFVPRCHGWP